MNGRVAYGMDMLGASSLNVAPPDAAV